MKFEGTLQNLGPKSPELVAFGGF